MALERGRPRRLGRSLLGLEPGARAKRQDVESLIGYFGLFAQAPVARSKALGPPVHRTACVRPRRLGG